MLDSAIQTIAAVGTGRHFHSNQTLVPFSVDEIELLAPLQDEMFAYVQQVSRLKFRILLTDKHGKLCVGSTT